jgi:hypothetical protein
VGEQNGLVPVLEHWDGSNWTVELQEEYGGYLADVAAISPTDAWVVGGINVGRQQTLVQHWDGVSWERVPAPSPGGDPELSAVDAVAANDVWAAGQYPAPGGGIQPLFLHWDGQRWRRVPPGPGTEQSGGVIFDLVVLSATDVWAVGYKGTPVFAEFEPLAEHWDGASWQVVDVPNPPAGANLLQGITGIATDDVWAVGGTTDGGFIEHWDGSAWSLELVENEGKLRGVAALSTDDVWATGTSSYPRSQLLHWDGTAWKLVRGPRAGVTSALLEAVAVSPNEIWAVGDYSSDLGEPGATLTERYVASC